MAGAARSRALDPEIGASDYLAQAWQTEGGLPSNRVRAILQTADGYLWIATQAGAARFDGDHFEIFNHSTRPELPVSAFLALTETGDGTLWLGSNEGLFSWRADRFGRYSTADGLASNHVQTLAEAGGGKLVVGTDRGITQFRGGHGSAPGPGWDQVRGIVRAYVRRADGSEFVGTDYGVWHTPGGSGADAGAPAPLDLPGSSFNCILDAPDGLWIGSSLGLYHLRRDGLTETIGTAQGLTNLRVLCLLRDRDGNLWIGTGGGLFRLHDGRIQAASYPGTLGTTTIQCLCEDRDGTLWVGSFSGLFALRNRAVTAIGSKEGLPNTGVTSVLETRDGAWWIGTWSGGAFRYEPRRGVTPWGHADASPTDHVLSLAETGDGALWIGGTRTALRILAGRTDDFFLRTEEERLPEQADFARDPGASFPAMFHNHAYSIAPDPAGGAWIGTAGALYRFQKGSFQVASAGLAPDTAFRSVLSARDGSLWVATNRGVLRLQAGRWSRAGVAEGLSTEDILSLAQDSAGSIWATTGNYGLNRFKDGRWRAYGPRQGLIDDQTVSLVEDDGGILWIGCAHGIMRIARRQFDEFDAGRAALLRPRLFTKADGMPLSECNGSPNNGSPNAWKTRDGRLLFPTDGGVAVVDPRRIATEANPPPIHIERMIVDGREELPGTNPSVPASSSEYEFHYTAISLVAPGQVVFKVKLSPLDADWRNAGNDREIRYPALPHGNYRFQVIAANGDGVWNLQGAACAFTVLPFFYQTAWFRGLAALLAGSAMFGAYRWRVRRLHQRAQALQRQNLALEHGIAERTRELALANSAKTEFLENISHEIRNPLNGIIGLVGMLREASLAARERELARSLSACSKVLARVFEQVLNFTKLEHGHVPMRETPFSLGLLVEEVTALFRMTARQRGIEIGVRREENVPDRLVGDEEKIESILGNFVANALKYAPGSPVDLLIQCSSSDEFGADITFNVTDRGPGIPHGEQELIFKKFVRGSRAKAERATGSGLGLATCRVLAELLDGHVGVESEPGHGATFFLAVRLKRDRRVAPSEGIAPPPQPGHDARALIVEDQLYNQIVMRRMAEQLGFAVDVAQDADEALAHLKLQRYAVVFIDWELPSMKGDELARRIRAQLDSRTTILIATTAHDSPEIQGRCLAAGMDGFALKPFDLETIACLIDRARHQPEKAVRVDAAPLDTRVFGFVGYDDPHKAAQAAALYLEILDQELAALARAWSQGKWPVVARVGHRLKSHAGLVGAAGLREAAERLQREAPSAPDEERAVIRQELLRQAAGLREQIRSWSLANAVG